jgi:hypothetical protein
MWDFSLGKAIGAMFKTLPFIFLRVLVYFGIALAYLLSTGIWAGVGYGLTSMTQNPGVGAFWGGLFGFALVSVALYWAREYLLYLVKAGHIAVLVEALDGKELPGGKGQVAHAQTVVKERFGETSILFAVDQLIKGILKALNRLVFSITHFIPLPGAKDAAKFINAVINLSLTYTDEIVLAYGIRKKSSNPWASAKDAILLYAENYGMMIKNALFLLFLMFVISIGLFLVFLIPAGALVALFPGQAGGWGFVAALLFAWAFKAAFLDPLTMACLMQVYFKVTEGKVPSPSWDQKLCAVSNKFRALKEKAAGGPAS